MRVCCKISLEVSRCAVSSNFLGEGSVFCRSWLEAGRDESSIEAAERVHSATG